jgi:hypothetical protein
MQAASQKMLKMCTISVFLNLFLNNVSIKTGDFFYKFIFVYSWFCQCSFNSIKIRKNAQIKMREGQKCNFILNSVFYDEREP